MGQRVSFIRINKTDVPCNSAEKSRLIELVFNPEMRDYSVVINIDKALQGLVYLSDGKIADDPANALIEQWGFSALLYNKDELNIYLQDNEMVTEREKQLTAMDHQWIADNYNAVEWMENKIYPEVWDASQGYNGLAYLSEHAVTLQNFYRQAAENKQVVVAIPN